MTVVKPTPKKNAPENKSEAVSPDSGSPANGESPNPTGDLSFLRLVDRYNEDQARFLAKQEYQDYYWSVDTMRFEVESEANEKQVFSLIPIGTWSPNTEQFTWAWANPKFPEPAQEAASSLKTLAHQYGNSVFASSSFDCPHMDLDEILAMSHHHFGSQVVFKEKNMEPWVFFAIMGTWDD